MLPPTGLMKVFLFIFIYDLCFCGLTMDDTTKNDMLNIAEECGVNVQIVDKTAFEKGKMQ